MTKEFWKATGIRAFRTFLQVILGAWTAGKIITELNWKVILMAAFSAAVYSVLTSIFTGLPEVTPEEHVTSEVEEPDDSYRDVYMTAEELSAEREAMGGDEDV